MRKYKFFLILILLFSPVLYAAVNVPLRANHPIRYEVKPGDTLWEVAARFLKNPWQWHLVWERNPQITYPDELYPGDILELHMVDGYPRIRLVKGGTVKLYPRTHIYQLRHPIPTIPYNAIKPFINNSRVMETNDTKYAPYVVAFSGDHSVGGNNFQIYARGIKPNTAKLFIVFRLAAPYIEPTTKQILGYPLNYMSKAALLQNGDPAILELMYSAEEVMIGDRLVPAVEKERIKQFYPREPSIKIDGDIISVLGEPVTQIGRYNSIVIDRGRCEGVQVGDVLSVYQRGEVITDRVLMKRNEYAASKGLANVKLPDRYAGQAMVYRVFDHVSYALILDAVQPIHVMDLVQNPSKKI